MHKFFILDEWVFSDLKGNNGEGKQMETREFLILLVKICDKIVILKNSPITNKILDLMSVQVPAIRQFNRFFEQKILRNSKKTLLVKQEELKPLGESMRVSLHRKDHYLIQTCLAVNKATFVSVDGRLANQLDLFPSIKARLKMRDEFVSEYLDRATQLPAEASIEKI